MAVSVTGLFAYFSHSENAYIVRLASFAPALIVVSVAGAVLAALGRRWIVLVAALAAVATGGALFGPLYIPNASADAGGRTIRVMQANLMLGLADSNAVAAFVREHDVDVLTVQELTFDAESALSAAGVDRALPYRFTRPTPGGGGGAGIYSRFPMSAARELPDFVLSNLVADLDVGSEEPLRVYSVHPVPPYPTPSTLWASEMELLLEEVQASATRPEVIVSGDFNSTRSHSRFRDILAVGYEDAADRTGSGLIATYPTDKPFPAVVGIDHVLTRGVTASSLQRITVPGSDHHGLIAEIALSSR